MPSTSWTSLRARGQGSSRSVWATTRPPTQNVSDRFTAPEAKRLYPQAALHTQWPGKGVPGNPAFDQFFASQVEGIADVSVVERLNRDAGVALLDRIGPAILLTHSQSGPFGWAIADARPRLVRAILPIEPNGPPFYENVTIGAPDWFKDGPLARGWGSRVRSSPTLPPRHRVRTCGPCARNEQTDRTWCAVGSSGASASVAEPPAHPDCDPCLRGLVPRAVRSLHVAVSRPSRRAPRLGAALMSGCAAMVT